MTAFQRILINTERWNETVVTPSLAKPHELICTPNRNNQEIMKNIRFTISNVLRKPHFAGWPKVLIEVYHLDWVGRSNFFGYGFVTVPTSPGAHSLRCYTWRPVGGLRQRFVQFFLGGGPQLLRPDLIFSSSDRYKLNTEPMGVVTFDLSVVLRNFKQFGVEYN